MDVPGLRPEIVPKEAFLSLLEILKFCHFLHHAYAVDLNPQHFLSNLDRLRRATAATAPRIGGPRSAPPRWVEAQYQH